MPNVAKVGQKKAANRKADSPKKTRIVRKGRKNPSDKVSAMRTFKVKANIAFSKSTSQDASSRSENFEKNDTI